jgi:hypothetical protein
MLISIQGAIELVTELKFIMGLNPILARKPPWGF